MADNWTTGDPGSNWTTQGEDSSGPVIVTPPPARAIAHAPAPAVVLGPITVTPPPVRAIARVSSVAVILGPVTVSPPPVRALANAPAPWVGGDAIIVVPPPVRAICRVPNPTVIQGRVVVTPIAARAVCRTAQPAVIYGPVTVTPPAVRAITRTSAPAIVPPRLYGAIDFRASLVTDRSHRGTLTITERTSRRLKVELFDENGLPVDGFAITRALFWIIDKTTGAVIRGGTPEEETPDIYPGEDFRGLFSSDGKLEILLTATDNRILSTHPRRISETHIVAFDIQVASRSDVLPLRAEKFITIQDLRSVA